MFNWAGFLELGLSPPWLLISLAIQCEWSESLFTLITLTIHLQNEWWQGPWREGSSHVPQSGRWLGIKLWAHEFCYLHELSPDISWASWTSAGIDIVLSPRLRWADDNCDVRGQCSDYNLFYVPHFFCSSIPNSIWANLRPSFRSKIESTLLALPIGKLTMPRRWSTLLRLSAAL